MLRCAIGYYYIKTRFRGQALADVNLRSGLNAQGYVTRLFHWCGREVLQSSWG